jgi:hypothetical protein
LARWLTVDRDRLCRTFIHTVMTVEDDKAVATEDVCRTYKNLVRTCWYSVTTEQGLRGLSLRRDADGNCTLLDYYAMCGVNSLPSFRDNLSVDS